MGATLRRVVALVSVACLPMWYYSTEWLQRSSFSASVGRLRRDFERGQWQSLETAAAERAAAARAVAQATARPTVEPTPSGRAARAPVDEPPLPPARAAPPRPLDHPPPTPRPVHATPPRVPAYMRPERSALRFNNASAASLAPLGEPRGATLHFTFGSAVMMDFVRNWLHFVRRARIGPVLVGAADLGLLQFCDAEGVPAAAIAPELDVWTYKRKPVRAGQGAYQIETEWKYFRHHNSDFLEMGLVKVAFLWELLSAGFDVLISDLDVVWLNGHWARWMSWAQPAEPPLPEAALIALADVLVTTDELDAERDVTGVRPGAGTDLNTGVVYFRSGPGSLAMIQQWRRAMLSRKGDKNLNENVNDQSLFNQVVRGHEIGGGDVREFVLERRKRRGLGHLDAERLIARARQRGTRKLYRSNEAHSTCLPSDEPCAKSHFTFGTLPMRAFTGGHAWFNQDVAHMAGHHEPRFEPVTVHFTFQFGDTGAYPHGKRQRAREAGLWAVDPPEYFTEGVFVAIEGPTYDADMQAAVYRRFPEWSPQRHMHMDAPQRRAVRDLLGLATAVDGIAVLPKLYCHCDRYWGFLRNCRFPMAQKMPLPFGCPQDALYDPVRWAKKNMRWREHTFLDNPHVPAALRDNKVTVSVADAASGLSAPRVISRSRVMLPYGTPISDVKAAVLRANADVRLIEIANVDLRRLCRWLGSAAANKEFNKRSAYLLTESSRYCPQEDMGGYGGPSFDWQNPFTAYNCTWGFHYPAPYPEDERACAAPVGGGSRAASGLAGVEIYERPNSTTCPRQMLCDFNTREDGGITRPITFCNIEGYGGIRPKYKPAIDAMLARMPGGRCPYPPGDGPGMPGFDTGGHYVGRGSNGIYEQYVRKHRG